jgi:hypothetical protein
MKHTAAILAGIVLSSTAAIAGITPAPMDKNPAPPADPCAGPISYTNIELLYQRTNFDGGGRNNGDAAVIRYEYGMKNFYFTLDVDRNSFEQTTPGIREQTQSWDIDQWKVKASIGGHIALTDNIHLAGDAGIVFSDIDSNDRAIGATVARRGPNGSDTGWFVRPQIRAKWGCLTIHAGGEYEDLGGDDHWTVYGRGYYQISPKWDVMLGVSTGDEGEIYSGGVRWRF